jgi:hypothetical protein
MRKKYCYLCGSKNSKIVYAMNIELSNNNGGGLSLFEQIRRTDENGNEYWSARDIAKVLEYSEYRHFLPVIAKAREACKHSGHAVSDHIEDILDMVQIGSGATKWAKKYAKPLPKLAGLCRRNCRRRRGLGRCRRGLKTSTH